MDRRLKLNALVRFVSERGIERTAKVEEIYSDGAVRLKVWMGTAKPERVVDRVRYSEDPRPGYWTW